jgi:hypothetical protein
VAAAVHADVDRVVGLRRSSLGHSLDRFYVRFAMLTKCWLP